MIFSDSRSTAKQTKKVNDHEGFKNENSENNDRQKPEEPGGRNRDWAMENFTDRKRLATAA